MVVIVFVRQEYLTLRDLFSVHHDIAALVVGCVDKQLGAALLGQEGDPVVFQVCTIFRGGRIGDRLAGDKINRGLAADLLDSTASIVPGEHLHLVPGIENRGDSVAAHGVDVSALVVTIQQKHRLVAVIVVAVRIVRHHIGQGAGPSSELSAVSMRK